MKQLVLLMLVVSVLITACGGDVEVAPKPIITITATALPSPTVTATATQTPTLTPTVTITPTPTTTRVHQGPDVVVVPILLYHRIDVSPFDNQYYTPPEKFEEQMKLLYDWEYTVITTETLVQAINEGANLPPRPVILTFDDGDISVYQTAFPIMQKYGLTGVVYIVGNYMGAEGYMNSEQIKELIAAGWEVGSHSRSHYDLTKLKPEELYTEIVWARQALQESTGSPVLTFAYPFGEMSPGVAKKVRSAGYIAAMGLGYTSDQGKSNLYRLERRDVLGKYDIKRFTELIPWQGDLAIIPTKTPTPTQP